MEGAWLPMASYRNWGGSAGSRRVYMVTQPAHRRACNKGYFTHQPAGYIPSASRRLPALSARAHSRFMPRGGGRHMDMDLHYMRPRECGSNYLGTLRFKTRRLGPRPPYRAFVGLRNPRYGLKRVLRIFGIVCVRLYWSESCMRMGSRGGSRIQTRVQCGPTGGTRTCPGVSGW